VMAEPGASSAVSAVVLNWRDPQRTLRCIEHLFVDPEIDQIIVVDNESDGELDAECSHRWPHGMVDVVESEMNLGFSAGVNLGLRRAMSGPAEYILCINNDSYLLPAAIRALLDCMRKHDELAFVAPRAFAPDGSPLSSAGLFDARRMVATDIDSSSDVEADFLTWACVLLRKSAVANIGFLDESFFMYWEDVEYSLRARRLGWAFRVVEGATLVHEINSSHERAGARIAQYSALGLVALARRLHKRRSWVGAFVRIGGRCARALSVFDLKTAVAVLRGAACGLGLSNRPAYEVVSRSD
jgi:N-acetylglucosaminyl-diphospho-decaprenol L-rhamnosyltransferase